MRRLLTMMLAACIPLSLLAQEEQMLLTIDEAIELGKEQTIASKENRNTMLKAYWRYRNYRADRLPSISLTGSLPSLNRSLNMYQQEDGAYKFVPNNYLSENLSLTVRQALPFSGGEISFESYIERMDQLGASNTGSFLSIPFTFTLTQPLTAYNPYRWQKKTEPLRYETSRQEYAASVENVNITTVSRYFDLLISRSNLESALQNRKNASELYAIALGKEKIGTISDSDLMQLKVGLLNADANVVTAENDCRDKMNALKNYLGLEWAGDIVPELPDEKSIPYTDVNEIMRKAQENNPIYSNFRLRMTEAEANVVKAKRERAPDVNLYVSVGATGSDRTFLGSYNRLMNRQIAQVGITIPILDWGKRRGNFEQAKSDYALEEDKVEREESDFNEKVRALAADFIDQQRLTEVYREADEVARQRYDIALKRFAVGDISVTDLNFAEQEKDSARQNYIYQLYLSWLYYYNIRYITLFDFETGQDIEYEYQPQK